MPIDVVLASVFAAVIVVAVFIGPILIHKRRQKRMDEAERRNYEAALKGLGDAYLFYYKKWLRRYLVVYIAFLAAFIYAIFSRTIFLQVGGALFLLLGLLWLISNNRRLSFVTGMPPYQLAKLHGKEASASKTMYLISIALTVAGAAIIILNI